MGHEVTGVSLALALAAAASAPAAGADVFYSSDAEDTVVLKTGISFDLRYDGPERRLGFRIERAKFTPLGQESRTMERAYLRAADSLGAWKWNATVGTDGRTLLGSASIHVEAGSRTVTPSRIQPSTMRRFISAPIRASSGTCM